MGEKLSSILLLVFSSWTHAQSIPPRGDVPPEVITSTEPASCSGSVAGAVIITIIVIFLTAFVSYFVYRRKRRTNSAKCKFDPECGSGGGYDNPHFIGDEGCDGEKAKNVAPSTRTVCEISSSGVKSTATNTSGTLDRGRSAIEKVLSAVAGGVRIGSAPKSKDDSCLEPRQTLVPLQGRDFSGLGFTILGNMKEGIYVKDVHLRGPASESGKVATGNKIMAVTVLMDHMVYEDAHSILSYASPYPVILHLENGKQLSSPFFFKGKMSPSASKIKGFSKDVPDGKKERIAHPNLCRSQSFDKLTNVSVQVTNLSLPKETSPRNTKKSTSPFIQQGINKEIEKYVKREGPNRYSERAIDVPGEDIRVKDEKENSELTSVQVHRSTQETEGDPKPFELKKANNQKQEATNKESSQDGAKPKFGVKVLPEIISFKEKNVKYGNIKKSPPIPAVNTTNINVEDGDKPVSGVSSISILSSKKGDVKKPKPKTLSSPSSSDDDNIDDLNLHTGHSTDDKEQSGSGRNHSINNKMCKQEEDSAQLASPPNLTFFSHANFPQSTSSAIIDLSLDGKSSEHITSIADHPELPDANLNSNSTNLAIDCQPPDVNIEPKSFSWSNDGAVSGESTPEHELDAAALDEVNATDATKKRKYRFMLASSSIALPDSHHLEESEPAGNGTQELWENQSDEVKSLNLKVKSPSLNLESGQNGTLDSDDAYFNSASLSPMNMALDLDDIELPEVGNVSDEKKMKGINNSDIPVQMSINDSSSSHSSENGNISGDNSQTENTNKHGETNNPRKISFTEFALSDAIPIDMTSLSFSAENGDRAINSRDSKQSKETFGSIFGFQGFKNRVPTIDGESNEEAMESTMIATVPCETPIAISNEVSALYSLDIDSGASNLHSGISQGDKVEALSDDAPLSKLEDVIVPAADSFRECNIDRGLATVEDSKKSKSKINFGFRGLNRSSSDTDEDKGKISSDPTGKTEKKDKIKSSLPFRFRSRSRSSDSEDSTDRKKVESDPSGIYITSSNAVPKSQELKVKHNQEIKETSNEVIKTSDNTKIQKPPRMGSKKQSDSEDDMSEAKIKLDPKAVQEKSKDSKSKSLKLGFKGLRNLKGKIQTEINKIRQEAPHSGDESSNVQTNETKTNVPLIRNEEEIRTSQKLDTLIMEHAASAVKENRRKISRKSSSSSLSSDEEGDNFNEQRKKKKIKQKKKVDKSRIVTTGVMQVEIPSTDSNMEVDEHIYAENRAFLVDVPNLCEAKGNNDSSIVDIKKVISIKKNKEEEEVVVPENEAQNKARYVVKTEMVLTPKNSCPNSCSIEEVFDKVTIERKIPRPMLIEERPSVNVGTDTDGGSYGSDSDLDNIAKGETSQSETSINLTVPVKRPLTDSEELKRKTASLGDLSRIHEGLSAGSILERAVSLDLNATSDNHGGLHVKRLKLPDSSATSIDEVEEKVPYSPSKLEQSKLGLKAASQWGTLEEALQLSKRNPVSHIQPNGSGHDINGLAECVHNTESTDISVSNIEISGECGPSITSLSSNEDLWDSIPYDTHPLSESIPTSKGKTTITLQNNASHYQDNHYKSDSSIVIVPGSSADRSELSNIKVHVPTLSGSTPDVLLTSNNFHSDESFPTYNHNFSGTYSPNSAELGSNKVTLTMISTEDLDCQPPTTLPPPVPPRPKMTQPSISPDLHSFDSGISAPVVTVSNDWSQCDPDVNVDISDLNSSDEFITPGGSPQKSMTHISLDSAGVSGYMVQDGEFSKTVIISNPDLIS